MREALGWVHWSQRTRSEKLPYRQEDKRDRKQREKESEYAQKGERRETDTHNERHTQKQIETETGRQIKREIWGHWQILLSAAHTWHAWCQQVVT